MVEAFHEGVAELCTGDLRTGEGLHENPDIYNAFL